MGQIQQLALRAAFIAVLIVSLLTVVMVLSTEGTGEGGGLPFLSRSRTSMASYLADTTFLVTLAVTAVGFRRFKDKSRESYDHLHELAPVLRVVIRFSVAVGFAVTLMLASVFILSILQRFLPTRYMLSQPIIFVPLNAIYAGILAYIVTHMASRLGTLWLLLFAGIVMLSGLIAAITLSTSLDWWTQAISWLGVDEYGIVFNLTFIMAGVLLLAVLQDKLGDLNILRRRGVFQSAQFDGLRRIMLSMCLLVSGVGFFPYYGITANLHQIISIAALVLFIIVASIAGRILPIYPPRYHRITMVVVIVSILLIVMHYGLGWLTFSIMELMLLGAGGVWIVTFYAYTRGFIARHDPTLITGRSLLVKSG